MAICIADMTFSYQTAKMPVFWKFSAEFRKGEILAVTGPNGCGKTTLARLTIGILKPQAGTVLIDGKNMAEMSLAETGRKIGFVMQDPSKQLFCISAQEEIAYGLKNMKLPSDEIRKDAASICVILNWNNTKMFFPFFLSQGEKQRLVLAAILAMHPDYLILDEPTASLDLYRQRLLREYLKGICLPIRHWNRFLLSHDRNFISACADKELHLDGRCKDNA